MPSIYFVTALPTASSQQPTASSQRSFRGILRRQPRPCSVVPHAYTAQYSQCLSVGSLSQPSHPIVVCPAETPAAYAHPNVFWGTLWPVNLQPWVAFEEFSKQANRTKAI